MTWPVIVCLVILAVLALFVLFMNHADKDAELSRLDAMRRILKK
jgi:hypothetical protein